MIGGWVKMKLKTPTLPRIRYMPCFDLTHAPVATAARAAATGLVNMINHSPWVPGDYERTLE